MSIKVPEKAAKAIRAWCNNYSAKLDRINNGSKEDYTGYEQDLFEAFGCRVFDSTDPVVLESVTTEGFVEIRKVYETKGLVPAVKLYRNIFRSTLIEAKQEVEEHASQEDWVHPVLAQKL